MILSTRKSVKYMLLKNDIITQKILIDNFIYIMELIAFCRKVFQIWFFLRWHIVKDVINHVIIRPSTSSLIACGWAPTETECRLAEVRSRSMSCNCMTRTSQQECRGILELRRTLSEKCRFFGRCSFLYCESYGR